MSNYIDVLRNSVSPRSVILAGILQSNEEGYTAPGAGDPPAIDYTIDLQDARIVEFDTGRGPELLADPTFSAGASGFTTSGSTLSVVNGELIAVSNAGGANPFMTQTLTGLTIGETYEYTCRTLANVTTLLFAMGSAGSGAATSVIVSTRRHASGALGLWRTWRPRFVATATSHVVTVSLEGTPTAGQEWMRCSLFSVKRVLTTGISYPIALETTSPYKDAANFAALGTNPNMTFARALLNQGRVDRVIQLNRAIGGAGLAGDRWDPDTPGNLYSPFVTELTAAVAANPTSEIILTTFGGEWDATVGNTSVDTYDTKFSTLIANLRAISGCRDMKVLVSTLIPEYAAATPSIRRIVDAQRQLPYLINDLKIVETPFGYQKTAEAFHMRSTGARAVGALRAQATLGWI